MHQHFSQSIDGFELHSQSNWNLWISPHLRGMSPALLGVLVEPLSVASSAVVKREKHKQITCIPAAHIEVGISELTCMLKWQRYRHLRHMLKANWRQNQRLTRHVGGMLRTEWMNHCYLAQQGISVPRPLAFAEKRVAGVICEQAYMTVMLTEAQWLQNHNLKYEDLPINTLWLQQAIALAFQLHEHSLYHLDFHPGNIMFQGGKVYLIDNEKVAHTRVPRIEMLAVMLGRLGFGLRRKKAEQAVYQKLAQTRLLDRRHNTQHLLALFEESQAGNIHGERLTKLLLPG